MSTDDCRNCFYAKTFTLYETSDDYVKVVRCKDCKFYKDSPMGGKGCHIHYNGRTEFIPKNDNDFCSYGERKNDV